MQRRIALQSDDIIRPTPSTDLPQKSYAEIMAGDSIKALAEALKKAPNADKQVNIIMFCYSTSTKLKIYVQITIFSMAGVQQGEEGGEALNLSA